MEERVKKLETLVSTLVRETSVLKKDMLEIQSKVTEIQVDKNK